MRLLAAPRAGAVAFALAAALLPILAAAPAAWAAPARAVPKPKPAKTAAAVGASAAASASAAQTDALRHRVGVLRRHVALAKAGHHYLVLDGRRQEMRLEMAGVPLRTWALSSVSASRPRRLLKEGPVPEDWDARSWTGGRLDPPRRDPRIAMTAPPIGGDPIVPPIPLPVEEAIPAPPAFLIRFEGGLAVEVRTPGSGGPARGLVAALREDIDLLLGRGDKLRIRVQMSAADAAALYRCLPPEAALLLAFDSHE